MASIKNSQTEFSLAGMVYLLFFAGLAAITYALVNQNYIIFAGVVLCPIAVMILLYAVEKPMLGYLLFAIVTCYFSAIYRYSRTEGLSIIMDICLAFSMFSIFINVISNRVSYPWTRGFNILTIGHLIWLSYCLLILMNPEISVHNFAGNRAIFLTLPLTYFISGVLMCNNKRLRMTLILLGIFVITAALKVYWQKARGFDSAETEWLMGGSWRTHLLRTGTRYFSFYSDAGNFGSSMGMFTFIFGAIASVAKKKIIRFSCIGIAILAAIGMIMSGTRGAIIVPFGGILLYILISKKLKMVISGILIGCLTFCFFYFTDIGNGNTFIRRMRTAFRPTEDASYNVRVENRKRFAYYLKDRPFGVGVGGSVVDKEELMKLDEPYIPTDSFYVGIWVQGGIVGLCLYLTIQVLVLLRCCYLLMFRIKNEQLARILAALLCGVFGLWLNGYVGDGMGFLPGSFLIALFLSFVLNGTYLDKQLNKNEIIA